MGYVTFALAIISICISSAAQLLLKRGLSSDALKDTLQGGQIGGFFLLAATSGWVLAGLLAYGLSMICWMAVLAKADVSVAYPMVGLGFVLTAVIAWLWLGESLGLAKVAGIALIVAGVFSLTRPGV